MATSIFQVAEALSRKLYYVLQVAEPTDCICHTREQAHGGTFHPECPIHHQQAAVLNPHEPRQRTIGDIYTLTE